MSLDDINAERNHAASTKGATGLPIIGLTIGSDGAWSARFWEKTKPRTYERFWCESVRVVGDALNITFMDELMPVPKFRKNLERTISAWGHKKQAVLSRLKIGIIGLGSVGSIISETLARMRASHVKLIDFDTIEYVNLDRTLHAYEDDSTTGRAKVAVAADAFRKSATSEKVTVEPIEWSVVEEPGFRDALDCDILFSCVDRPWPRAVLNFIAYAHLIPVIDGGIAIKIKPNGTMRSADWKSHIVGPGRKCLECLGQYDSGLVSADREGYFDDPTYIQNLPIDHSIKRNENVFAFSLSTASFHVLQMLSMVVAPSGLANVGAQNYHFVTGTLDADRGKCKESCLYPSFIAKGDSTGIAVTGKHVKAEAARELRRIVQQTPRSWIDRITDLCHSMVSILKRIITRT
ncbi:MAG: ThiF family adenylyltransferase [Nitrospirae bacterium]|nr:ThiF family adenylyltransferase [Nitrospirota bacterium]